MSDLTILYLDSAGERFFLVPQDTALPPGEFLIVSLDGIERRVDPQALVVFEISREHAQQELQSLLSRGIEQANVVIGSLLDSGGIGGTAGDPQVLARLLGMNPVELRRNPQAAKAGLLELFGALKDVVAHATSDDPAGRQIARDQARFLRNRLSKRGIELGDAFEQLPDLLRFAADLDEEHAARFLTEQLREFVAGIDQNPESLGKRIDAALADLERRFGPLVGIDKARDQQRIYNEARSSARSAIAASLRAHGITPLTAEPPERTDTSGRHETS